MPNLLDGLTTPDVPGNTTEEDAKCPACGAVWKKTEPNLAQVRGAVRESLQKHVDELLKIEASAQLGYRGSVARGTVGNPNKEHYELEPDIRGECGQGYDVDGFTLMGKVYKRIRPDKFGKRWAARDREMRGLEKKMRASLNSRGELKHMKKGAAGFELLVRHYREQEKLFKNGGVVMIAT